MARRAPCVGLQQRLLHEPRAALAPVDHAEVRAVPRGAGLAPAGGRARGLAAGREVRGHARLGFGRTFASEIEAPNMLVNPV
jgi:hypothetical protein